MRRLAGDIDIDFPNRSKALSVLDHVKASIIRHGKIDKHNTGVYFHAVPLDPLTGMCSVHYEDAEERGWFKIDLLNVGVYEQIKDEHHLTNLMSSKLEWSLLEYPEFTSQLIHIGGHADMVASVKPKNLEELAMVLALIRPGKRHLLEKCQTIGFSSIKDDIWKDVDGQRYSFKHAHAISYAMLVKVHANLLVEQASA